MTVIDHKQIPSVEIGVEIVPEVKVYNIPKIAIEITSRRKTELKEIVTKIKKTYTGSEVESIQIQDFGTVEKVSVLVNTGVKLVEVEYLVDSKTKETKEIEVVTIPEVVKGEFYEETTNKYG